MITREERIELVARTLSGPFWEHDNPRQRAGRLREAAAVVDALELQSLRDQVEVLDDSLRRAEANLTQYLADHA